MITNIEGISAETVEAVAIAIRDSGIRRGNFHTFTEDDFKHFLPEWIGDAQVAITALLSSGEVVLRKDVEELVGLVQGLFAAADEQGLYVGLGYNPKLPRPQEGPNVSKIRKVLAKFTKQEG